MVAFARWYEGPALLARHGTRHEACREQVPGWLPRWRPAAPDGVQAPAD